MRHWIGSLAVVALTLLPPVAAHAQDRAVDKVQAALDRWLAARAPVEKVTGVAAYVSFGTPGPTIEAFAGKVGRNAGDAPVGQDTLFQMGSTTKSFAAAILLQLESEGRLTLDDTLGRWLPEYPAWKDVSLRRLLNMTSGLPNYSETEAMSRAWIETPQRILSAAELVALAYPAPSNALPPNSGYFYSNTNYILAGMVAAKAAGKPYRDQVHERLLQPLGLHSMFYEDRVYPPAVTARLAHGWFENPGCAEYQPKCTVSWNQRLVGRDVRELSLGWGQAAGGGIANARDLSRWQRAVFEGRVVPPKQQAEWLALVSTRTGQPIADVSADNPGGFALGLARGKRGDQPAQWFYEGMTLGYRSLYVWFEAEKLMITVQTNSQPADGEGKLADAVSAIHEAVRR
ncbi:MAG: serine hydrolase domain-containing protein [Reyranellaceae bacterium]